MTGRFSDDRGSATVWSVGAIALLCVVFGVGLALGQAVVTRHRAAGAADLAALAAAEHWAQGRAPACAAADRVARAQGAWLARCALTGDVSDVTAVSRRGLFTARSRARAGPPGPPAAGARASGSAAGAAGAVGAVGAVPVTDPS
ncbi:Rv3654c family TadE-like protein [Streptomyces sp. NPDC046985]|uniref:Rv3654c family TadE-like protein n=1 Tax=Streptomyces sp. NPDC046985 TaxID=3155377 RepID=UPI0033E4A107